MNILSVLKSTDSQLHWTARCLIRVCLLFSLWNLPFPWIHNHDVYQESESTSSWLFSHVDDFHSDLEEETKEQGWHLHFVYFGEEDGDAPLKNRFPAQHYFIVGESSQTLPASESAQMFFLLQMFASTHLNSTSATLRFALLSDQDRARVGHSLKSFQSKSLRDLISVSLC